MQIKTILRLIGLLLMIFSLSMLTPLIFNIIFQEPLWLPFYASFICTFTTGSILWLSFNKHHHDLKIRDGFLIVVLFWFILCFFASLPFLFVINELSITDALFESVSGFTTTGATILTHLERFPHSLLFYRQQLQFLGGMGIVVLAVAILPMLGVGGMQLYRAETPGPMKESKLTPRITQTAKTLWSIYFILTLACFLCYIFAGMDWFDALGESFATVSTGGFSLHDASFSYYHSSRIELIASLFMLIGATNFGLHFMAFKTRSLRLYWQDEEFYIYVSILFFTSCVITLTLIFHDAFNTYEEAFGKSLFNVVSLATTTGFVSASFGQWPTFTPVLMLLLAIIGGCAASTSGGIKVLRALLLYKQSMREMLRLIHPHGVIPIKFGKTILAEAILQSMWGFIATFIAIFLILMMIFMALGNDFYTAFSAITASLANAGAGVGSLSITYAMLSTPSKWLLMFAMIAGRLEIFSLLILLSPQFWRK